MLSGLFNTTAGIASLTEVVSAREDSDRGIVNVTLRNGQTVQTYGSLEGTFAFRAVQLIPAEPGWNSIRAWMDNGQVEVRRTPVIGWALCADGCVRVVTVTGVEPEYYSSPLYVETAAKEIIGVGFEPCPSRYDSVEALAVGTSAREAEEADARNAR